MTSQSLSQTNQLASTRVARLAPLCLAAVAAVGALVLLGWTVGVPPWSQHAALSRPSAALAFVLLGCALWLRLVQRSGAWRRVPIAGCVLGIELLAAQRWLALGLDRALSNAHSDPGQVAPATALALALLGLVPCLLADAPRPRDRSALALTLLALFFSLGALAGHGYGVGPQHAGGLEPMAPLSALLFTLACLGIFAARTPPDVAALFVTPSPSARAVRELLLGVISIPVLLSLLERATFARGLHETEFGMTMTMVANMLLVFALTMRCLRALLSAERERARLAREVDQIRELTARYETQQALLRSEQKYRALAMNAPVGIFESTLDGQCTFVNEAWTRITGYSVEEVLGRGWERAVHPDDLARLTEVWTRATRSDASFSLDFRYRTKTGEVTWVHGSAVPLLDPDGHVQSLMGTVVDMTERRQTLEALSKSEQNFRSLVERAPFGVIVTRELIVSYANEAYLSMLGYQGDELVGTNALALMPPEAHALALERLHDLKTQPAGARLSAMPTRVRRKDGSLILVEGASAAMEFDGEPATVSLVRDVTDRERAEQVRQLAELSMRESLREKDVLLKEIHHRVKNNLQVIVSLINLQASKLSEAATRGVFEETRNRVHAIALLHERLYTSKNIGRIDMRDYLDGLASDLSSSNSSLRPVELVVSSDEVYLEMDQAVPVGLIVNELVSNAFKHAFPARLGRGGRIELKLERIGDTLQISVTDDGVGYPSDFDPERSDSLGLLLISSLSHQLDAELRFVSSGGARCVVRGPYRERLNEQPPARAS